MVVKNAGVYWRLVYRRLEIGALWTRLVSMGSFDELPVGAVARAPIDVLTSKRTRTTFDGS